MLIKKTSFEFGCNSPQVLFGFGISVFGKYLYITNWLEEPTITRVNKFSGSASVIRTGISNGAGAVKVYHEAVQPLGEFALSVTNGR